MGRDDNGYEGIYLELQQDQNALLVRIAEALERIADVQDPPHRTFADAYTTRVVEG